MDPFLGDNEENRRVGNPGPDLIETFDPLLTGHHIRPIERQSPPPGPRPPTASPPPQTKPRARSRIIPLNLNPVNEQEESACVRMGKKRESGHVQHDLTFRSLLFSSDGGEVELAQDRTPR